LADREGQDRLKIIPRAFCDGTRRYGVPALFSQVEKQIISNVYY